jgi:hypothetical protein
MRIPLLFLLAAGQIFAADDVFPAPERIVAVGDVHGDFDAFTTVLRSAGVIDQRNRWTGGKTHLVQLGDVLDRGPDSRKAMDLLIALEKQAQKAGGQVHALIGNHEAMNLYGDLRYTSPAEFAAFRTDDSGKLRDVLWDEEQKSLPSKPDREYRKKWEAEHPLGWFEHRYAFGPEGDYGKWIRSHKAVIRIGDSLFLHGGISPRYASMTIGQMNDAIAGELNDFTKINDHSAVAGDESPLWYRGLTTADGDEALAYVDRLLKTYEVKRIVIAHTPTFGAVMTRFNGKVVLVDVGLSEAYGSRRACLVLEPPKAYVIHRGKRIDLPVDEKSDYLRYLNEAMRLDPPPSPLEAFVKDFAARLVQFSPR